MYLIENWSDTSFPIVRMILTHILVCVSGYCLQFFFSFFLSWPMITLDLAKVSLMQLCFNFLFFIDIWQLNIFFGSLWIIFRVRSSDCHCKPRMSLFYETSISSLPFALSPIHLEGLFIYFSLVLCFISNFKLDMILVPFDLWVSFRFHLLDLNLRYDKWMYSIFMDVSFSWLENSEAPKNFFYNSFFLQFWILL